MMALQNLQMILTRADFGMSGCSDILTATGNEKQIWLGQGVKRKHFCNLEVVFKKSESLKSFQRAPGHPLPLNPAPRLVGLLVPTYLRDKDKNEDKDNDKDKYIKRTHSKGDPRDL